MAGSATAGGEPVIDLRQNVWAVCSWRITSGVEGQAFNVCSGQAHSLREIIALTEQITGHTMEIRVNPAFVRANEVPRLLGNSAKLQAHLGPQKQIPLEATLRWMLEAT